MAGYVVLGGFPWGATLGCGPAGCPRCAQRSTCLGALTPDQAAEQVFPKAQIRSGAGHDQIIWGGLSKDAAAGQLLNASGSPAYIPGTGDCSATGQSGNVQLAQRAGSLALTGLNAAAMSIASVGEAIGAALGPATLGISAIIGLFPLLFGHHAAAVKKEQSVLCSAVPAANNYLQIIDQAVRNGQATPQSGIQALSSLLSDFQSQVSSIMHGESPASAGECNAACVQYSALKTIVLYRQSQYQDLAAAAPSTSGGGPTTASMVASGSTLQIPQAQPAASSSGPNWMGIAALVIGGFLIARAL